jgi:hypothetical protein
MKKDKKGKVEAGRDGELRKFIRSAWSKSSDFEFTIKKLLLYPYFFAILLSLLLIITCILKNDPGIKIAVLVAVLVPFYYFFLELIFRKVVVTKDFILMKKFLRKKKITVEDIVQVGTASFKSKTYIFIELKKGRPVIISNSYGRFGDLLNAISDFTGESELAEGLKNLPKSSYAKHSDTISVWVAILLFVLIIIVRFLEK